MAILSRRWAKRTALGGAVFLIVAVFLLWFLIFTNLGLRFSLAALPPLFHAQIRAGEVEGTLYQGFKLKDLYYEDRDAKILAREWSLTWAASPGLTRPLAVREINLGVTRFIPKKNPDKVTQLPRSLQFPFKFKVERIILLKLYSGEGDAAPLTDAVLRLNFDRAHYDLKIEEMKLLGARGTGKVQIFTQKPYPIEGKVTFYDLNSPQTQLGEVTLKNNLQELWVNAGIEAPDLRVKGFAHLSPFDPIATRRVLKAEIEGTNINPHKLLESWPKALVNLKLVMNGSTITGEKVLLGSFNLVNAKPGYYADQYLPIRAVDLNFMIPENGTVELAQGSIETLIHKGIRGSGKMNPDGTIAFNTEVDLSLTDFMDTPLKNRYSGTATLSGNLVNPLLRVNVASPLNQLVIDANFNTKTNALKFNRFLISKKKSYLAGAGTFFLRDKFALNLALVSRDFDPQSIWSASPAGKINGRLEIKGNIAESLALTSDISKSTFSGEPFASQGFVLFNAEKIQSADFKLNLGTNALVLQGTPQNPQDEFLFSLKMPKLAQFGFGFSGSAEAEGVIQGTFSKLKAKMTGRFNEVVVPHLLSLRHLNFDIDISPELTAPLKVDLQGSGLSYRDLITVNNIKSLFTGTLAQHSGRMLFDLVYQNRAFTGVYEAAGSVDEDYLWTGVISKLNLTGFTPIILHNPVSVKVSTSSFEVGPAKWSVLHGLINLDYFSWRKGEGIKTKGKAEGIHLKELEAFVFLPFEQNLVLGGDWQINYSNNASGYLRLKRQSGSLVFSDRKTDLGLKQLDLNAQFVGSEIKAVAAIDTRFMKAKGELTLAQNFGGKIYEAPLKGTLTLASNNIDTFKYTLPVGVSLQGSVAGKIGVTGTLANPNLSGYLDGDNMAYRDLNNGIFLKNGKLHSRFNKQQWVIDAWRFKNPDGEVTLSGVVGKNKGRVEVDLDLALNHYQIINEPTRLFIVSGAAKLANDDAGAINITGNLSLDKGYYENLGDSMPNLSADVHVVGEKIPEETNLWPVAVNVVMDLNNQFRFILSDLNFLLGGKVRFIAGKGEALKVFGKLVAVEGSYRAYGQNLHVDEGSLTFTGDPKNGLMNIKASRFQSPVGAGINVIGTLSDPKVTLTANEAMSDQQKLSWLILGHGTDDGKDNEAFALAAGILAAEKVNKEAGGLFDNIGLSSRKTRNTNTGELNPAEQMVTFGKQINHNLYVGYEIGVQSATQAVRLIYAISKKMSIFTRFETESGSGGIKYKIRFD